jgi:capsular exopolysaccharide synthesis family protein
MSTYSDYEEDEVKEQPVDLLGLFFRYLSYWKWFAASLIICMALAVMYLKVTTPVYEIKSTVLLKDDKKGGGTPELSALKDMGLLNTKNNVDNELEILKTSDLTQLVVRDLGLYVQYTEIGTFRNTPLYGSNCPIKISLAADLLDTLKKTIEFKAKVIPRDGVEFSGTFKDNDFTVKATSSDSVAVLPFGNIYFRKGEFKPDKEMTVGINIQNPVKVAAGFLANMTMELTSKLTSVVEITLKATNIERGKDFVNKLIDVYNVEDMKDQNMVASNTAVFIDNRLLLLTGELGDVESQVESYKQKQGLTDIKSEADLFLKQTGDYEQRRMEVETQLAIVTDLDNYIHKKENRYRLLPSGTGIQSTNLNELIKMYNQLLLDRNRLSRTASPTNQAMIDITAQIDGMLSTVQSSVRNEKNSLMITRKDLIEKGNENTGRIRSIPRQEREYTEIKRQQGVKEALYLFLLQKKEENFLNMMVVVPKAKMIDSSHSSGAPVSPQRTVILIIAFLLGFVIPVLVIYVRNSLRYFIENKDELEKLSIVPILGEIPKSELTGNIIIRENSTNRFTEMFRLIRANLLFILNGEDKKVINIVSSIAGEGKTFTCINLGMILALLDKKVLIIGLDIRKPRLGQYLDMDNETGISLYLSGHFDKNQLIRPSGVHPNLSVITGGPVPPNPNELLARPLLDELIAECKKQYDFIILDTPPIGIVSDGFTLNRFADVNLYLVRAEFTPKKNIEEATAIYRQKKLTNMYFVLNASDLNKGTYRYGYGKKYGYGYGNKYGYGYGYGEGEK